ncbi:hypothetical protein JTB14_014313 [Gonioctena quinquepunctata]|nr:hypothetical protein JTB14_014313 [Gonioctena quinquepunctata]
MRGEIFRFLCQEGPTSDSGYHDKNIGHITTSLGVWKSLAESIEGKIEEIVTEIQTGTEKKDAGKQIGAKDSVPEPVEQEIQENKDLVEPSLEMISTEKQPREVFQDITSIDTAESVGCSTEQE